MYWGEEEEEEELIDLIKCHKCLEVFFIVAETEPKECPLCGEVFDDGELK